MVTFLRFSLPARVGYFFCYHNGYLRSKAFLAAFPGAQGRTWH